jgi:hypothetical protein
MKKGVRARCRAQAARVSDAVTRKRPSHCRQVSLSMANTRFGRYAQDIARCRSVAAASPRSLAAAAQVLGTIRARSGLAGANTPWYLVR